MTTILSCTPVLNTGEHKGGRSKGIPSLTPAAFASEEQQRILSDKPKFTVSVNSYNSLKLKWSRVSGADGYEIYRAATRSGRYIRLYTTRYASTLSYNSRGLTLGKTYYYKIRAYRDENGSRTYSPFSDIHYRKVRVGKVKNVVFRSTHTPGQLAFKYDRVGGASGYEGRISYRKSDGTWSEWKKTDRDGYGDTVSIRCGTDSYGQTSAAVNYIAEDGRTFRFRFRAYKRVKGRKYYGQWSAPIIVKETLDVSELSEKLEEYIKKKDPDFDWYDREFVDEGKLLDPDNASWRVTDHLTNISVYSTCEDAYREIKGSLDNWLEMYNCHAGCLRIVRVGKGGDTFKYTGFPTQDKEAEYFVFMLH